MLPLLLPFFGAIGEALPEFSDRVRSRTRAPLGQLADEGEEEAGIRRRHAVLPAEAHDLTVEGVGLDLARPVVEVLPERGAVLRLLLGRDDRGGARAPELADAVLDRRRARRALVGDPGRPDDADTLLVDVGHPRPHLGVRPRLVAG